MNLNIQAIRLITFDVTGTLLKFKKAPGKQYSDIGIKYGIKCDPNILSNNFKIHWKRMNKDHPNYGLKTGLGWENWWKQIIFKTFQDANQNIDSNKLEVISSHLIDLYKKDVCWQINYGALDLLSYLKSKRIPIGVISNYDPRLDVTLENLKIRHYFSFIASSYQIGTEKPDATIFKKAMSLSGLSNIQPEECLHVGDVPHLDYKGAKAAEWQAVLIRDDYSTLDEPHHVVPTNHVFPTLFDFHKILIEDAPEKLKIDVKS